MDIKTSGSGMKVVDEASGQVQAVFSTLNVIDKDGDVTLPGAFGNQNVRISAYNHASWQGELPVGKGTIHESGDEAILNGIFFMGIQKAADTFHTIRQMDDPGMEWSYGYDILNRSQGKWPENEPNGKDVQFLHSLKVHEVSPVILGAGENTRTLSAKGLKRAIPYAQTGTTDVNWDAGLMLRQTPSTSSALRALCAWVDDSGDPDAKSSYKFPHHMVSETGAVGAANTRACSAVIAVLNGGRGGSTIPDGDRQGVYDHVSKHMKAAGLTPPLLKSYSGLVTAGYESGAHELARARVLCAESLGHLRIQEPPMDYRLARAIQSESRALLHLTISRDR